MFYYVFSYLIKYYSGFNLFKYITVRSFFAFLTGFIICVIISPFFIKYIKSKQFVQTIREDGPTTHQVKKNTPTMGGIIILISLIISSLLWARPNKFVLWANFVVLYLGILGFVDDYLKVIKKHPRGVSAYNKIFFQLILAILLCIFLYFSPNNYNYKMVLHIPYLKEAFIYIGIGYFFVVILTLLGSSNGVNLTDGLDGLAIGNLIFVSITYAILSYVSGNFKLASYLKLIYVPGAGEITVFLSSLVGVGLGFLWYNCYPAAIFMGDTGSLFLGGVIGTVAIFIHQELLLIISAGIFVVEVLSVVLQVWYYKRTKKRIFLMAPLHHHFELSGWHETKVTIRFWIISIILSMISLASLKIR
jgi:phospho-N-acetylmuramoyl-pentapeptide-transferase